MLAPTAHSAAAGQEPREGPRREHCPHGEADLALPTKTELGHPHPTPYGCLRPGWRNQPWASVFGK